MKSVGWKEGSEVGLSCISEGKQLISLSLCMHLILAKVRLSVLQECRKSIFCGCAAG